MSGKFNFDDAYEYEELGNGDESIYEEEREAAKYYGFQLHEVIDDARRNENISTLTVFANTEIDDAFIGGVICSMKCNTQTMMNMLFQLTKQMYKSVAQKKNTKIADDLFKKMYESVKRDDDIFVVDPFELAMRQLLNLMKESGMGSDLSDLLDSDDED